MIKNKKKQINENIASISTDCYNVPKVEISNFKMNSMIMPVKIKNSCIK